MKNLSLKLVLSVFGLFAIFTLVGPVNGAPVKFKQIVQVVSANPGQANIGSFSTLRLNERRIDPAIANDEEDDDKTKKSTPTQPQDGRVITTTIAEITDEGVECDCTEAIVIEKGGFPKWPLFGLGAVPFAFIKYTKDPEGSPTPTPTTTATPTPTTQTPTPPEPVPEPMTLLLFGTGLAGVGLAARKKFGKQATEGN